MSKKKSRKTRSVLIPNLVLLLLVSFAVYESRGVLLSLRKQAKASASEIENRVIAVASEIRYPSMGLDDYQPIRGTGNEVDPGALEAPTYTGSDSRFDPDFYIYRTFLSEEGRQIYNQIYENALSCNTDRFTLVTSVSEETLEDAMTAVYNDHPELFWLDTAFSFGYLPNGDAVSVTLSYNEMLQDLPSYQWAFGYAAEQALASVKSLPSDIEKERAIHDYLLSNVTYDTGAAMHQSAYSALVLGSSVCAGYCRAFQYLLQSVGIPCYYCTGTAAGGDHAWNIVRINGEYYNIDPSWNDSSVISYAYFNVPDSAFSADHTRTGLSVYLPACTSERMSYLTIFGGSLSGVLSQPTYQSLGYEPADVLSSLSEYNLACRDFLIHSGTGTHTLCLILSGQDLLNQVLEQVRSRGFVDAYAQGAAESLHLSSSTISITLQSEPLAGGYFLLTQTITLTEAGK